jgi:hypothetical protein
MNDNIGLKQLVKAGKLTAKSAFNRLFAKADLNGEAAIVKQSRTYKWLAARMGN